MSNIRSQCFSQERTGMDLSKSISLLAFAIGNFFLADREAGGAKGEDRGHCKNGKSPCCENKGDCLSLISRNWRALWLLTSQSYKRICSYVFVLVLRGPRRGRGPPETCSTARTGPLGIDLCCSGSHNSQQLSRTVTLSKIWSIGSRPAPDVRTPDVA